MSLPDPRELTPAQRAEAAWRARQLADIDPWPSLKYFNDQPCSRHEVIDPRCPACGLVPRQHQRVGAAWMFLAMNTLLSDVVGSGKTLQLALVLALAKETGELSTGNRAVVVCQAAAVRDPWAASLRRLLPGVLTFIADGTPAQREKGYLAPWEVCVISDRTFAPATGRDGDVEILRQLPVTTLIYDDVDPMRNRDTRTAYAIRRLAAQCSRVHGMHGTPQQKRLTELYGFLEPIGGRKVFGTPSDFKNRFVTQKKQLIWIPVNKAFGHERDAWARGKGYSSWAALRAHAAEDRQAGRTGKSAPARTLLASAESGRSRMQRTVWKDNGINPDRLPEFQRLRDPFVLRRTAADLHDVTLPEVQVSPIWLDLLPEQRKRYAELRKGTLTRLKQGGEVEVTEARAIWTRGAQICSGLASLDEGHDVSAKLDRVIDLVTGDLDDEKVVIYVHFKPNVVALSNRLDEAGVGYVRFWSEETGSALREARRQQFISDPATRVLIGTTTIERSLNLQVAGHMIAVDTIMNASRMEQMVGRIRRQGSRYSTVFLHHLLAIGTQEDAYPDLLASEANMTDAVWGEDQALFGSTLTPRGMLQVIATGSAGAALQAA